MLETVLHGLILGFGLILPVGVQNVFVFNQGARGRSYLKALPVILTASVCDTILILLAVLGVSFVVLTFAWLQAALYGFGLFFLLYMGWVLWRSKPGSMTSQRENEPKKQILFAASVSLMNPHAILDTIGIIGTNSLQYVGGEKWVFITKLNKVSACMIWAVAVLTPRTYKFYV